MSNPNPFERRYSALKGGLQEEGANPFERRYNSLQREQVEGNAGEGGVPRVMPLVPSAKAVGAHTISGLLSPFEGLLGLPGEIAEAVTGEEIDWITDRAAATIQDWRNGIVTAGEAHAKSMGYTDHDLRANRMLGEVVGFIAPGTAVYKGTAKALGVGGRAIPFVEGLKVDVASGMVWGGVFTPGEIEDRLKNAAIEGGLSGAVGLALTGAWPALIGYRNNRLAQKHFQGLHDRHKQEILRQFYERKAAGEIGSQALQIESPEVGRGLFEQMSEESFFLNSPAGQDLLARQANETALLQSIVDVAGAKASNGVVRQISSDFPEAMKIVDNFKEQFPTMKFDVLKAQDGGYDIIFGTKGLSNKAKQQFTREGRYEGQRVLHQDGTEYEYVKRLDGDRIELRRLDTGNRAIVKSGNISDMPYGIEPELRAPSDDPLYGDFESFFRERDAGTLNERYSFSEVDLVTMVRQGRLREAIQPGRRKIDEPNAITQAEEIGGRVTIWGIPEGQITSVPLRPKDAIEGKEGIIIRNTDKTPGITEKQSLSDAELTGDITSFSEVWRDNPNVVGDWALVHAANDEVIDIRMFKSLDEAAEYANASGWDIADIEMPATREISQTGTEHNWILDPWEGVTFEDAVRLWAQERGLPTDGAEFISLQTGFANRMRRNLLDRFMKDFPEEADVINRLRNEWIEHLDTRGMSQEQRAAVRGFHLRSEKGQFTLQDINSGAKFAFPDRQSVEAALEHAVRGDRDLGSFGLPPDAVQPIASPNAVPDAPAEEIIADFLPDNALHINFQEDLPTRITTNTKDLLQKYEERTGLPIWRQGFLKMDEGSIKAFHEYGTWGSDLDRTWKRFGIKSRNDGVRLGRYLMRVEKEGIERGARLADAERKAIADEMGLSAKDLQAIEEFRKTMDAGFVEYGLDPESYIEDYFGRVLPYTAENGVLPEEAMRMIWGQGNIPKHLSFFAEYSRTGTLSQVEHDIRIVGHKWFKTAAMKRHMDEPYKFMSRLIRTRIRDLPEEHRVRLKKGAGRQVDDGDLVIAEPLANVIKEYLNAARGAPVSGVKTTQTLFKKLYEKMGIKVDERISTEFFNTMLSTMYGAAMGARPQLLARNHLQTMWNLYTRLGGKHFNQSMKDVIDPAMFREAIEAGAIREAQAGLPLHDAIWEEIAEAGASGTGTFSNAAAAAMNAGVRAGKVSRTLAEKTLIPYGSGDMFSRAWAYHYQKRHTADFLRQYEQKRISWDTFMEKGLPFFDRSTRQEFYNRYKSLGKEEALRYVGRIASEETHFIYGMGMQPAWMQNPFGKFMGMFGTWPLWQKEVYARILRNGTRQQKYTAAARTALIGGALTLVGTSVGINMWNWAAPTFFMWTGGPGVDYAINMKNVIDAPLDRKAQSLGRLAGQIPRLALPGQVLMSDIGSAINATDDPGLQAMYLMVGRPTETHYLDFEFAREDHNVPRGAPTNAPPTSAMPASAYQQIGLEALGLEPKMVGGGVTHSRLRPDHAAIIEWLGGNVPK